MLATFPQCTVRQLIQDLARLALEDALLMIEVDGHAVQPTGIQSATYAAPDGSSRAVVLIVGKSGEQS